MEGVTPKLKASRLGGPLQFCGLRSVNLLWVYCPWYTPSPLLPQADCYANTWKRMRR